MKIRELKKYFTDPKSAHYFLVSDILAFFTVLSILAIVLETVPGLEKYKGIFLIIEWVSVAVFTFEYVIRVMASRPWHAYSFSFFGVIDLVAILPTFLGVGNLTFLKSARVLRILRFLRMVRLAKLSRVSPKEIEESYGVFVLNIGIYFSLLLTALLLFGTALFVVEETAESFISIPASMWWSFKVFIGSIPVDAPLSALGGVLYVLARFCGLILLGILIGVVGNIFRATLLGERK